MADGKAASDDIRDPFFATDPSKWTNSKLENELQLLGVSTKKIGNMDRDAMIRKGRELSGFAAAHRDPFFARQRTCIGYDAGAQ